MGIAKKKQKGHLKPIRRKYAYQKSDDELLSKYVEQHPDYFLSEIADYFSVTPQTIFYAFKRLHEKKTTRYKERDEKKREAFMKDLENILFDKRIYLDETGIHQFLFREPGRSLHGKKVLDRFQGPVL